MPLRDVNGQNKRCTELPWRVEGSTCRRQRFHTSRAASSAAGTAEHQPLQHRHRLSSFQRPLCGVSQDPVVTYLKQSKDRAWLRCVVRGAPPDLRLQWEDGSGTPLAAHQAAFPVGGVSDDLVLNVTVTQTDRYRCVATGRTGRRSEAETHVYIAGEFWCEW
ncbi:hypothetical protein EYF80_053582 [Liparis tanakae]|uniref:Ig-like domain-containing protein n=1 Tax=Liparis tanakae TaxID=230148 RepID=A0A4Z2F560_9TELE|nr:hypothetical protein EYF80_053582 [Liparis tanakae]